MNADPCDDLLCRPIIIIGAGRSGTNMLRNVLTKFDTVITWPCDEINYIWRYGNRDKVTDEFEIGDASSKVINFIRGHFRSLSFSELTKDSGHPYVIEKTCANSLRVDFVNVVIPEARYIYLVRDGRDVVASAMKRWKAPLDLPYLIAKAKYVPKADFAFYGLNYLKNRLEKLVDPEARLSVWGPKFNGWQEVVAHNGLSAVCAHQWIRCIERSELSFAAIPKNQVYRLKYEDFVADPKSVTSDLVRFLNIPVSQNDVKLACSNVSSESVGKGALAKALPDETVALMAPTLRSLGYAI